MRGPAAAFTRFARAARADFSGVFSAACRRDWQRAHPPCLRKLKGTLIVDPLAPGASNFARLATPWMQLATWADRPELLAADTESTSPLGATLIKMTSFPACEGSVSSPF